VTRRSFLVAAAAQQVRGAAARIDADGMMIVGGKRTFLHGLYQLPNVPDPWRAASEAGFQFASAGAGAAALDEAFRHGMSGWVAVGSISPSKRRQDEERIRKQVGELKAHPALLFWETEDEPSFQWKKPGPRVTPEVIRETYRFLKSLDPDRPVYLNHSPTNLVSTLQQYNPGADILATDIYPVIPHGIREQYALWPDGRQGDLLNPYISQVGQYAAKIRQVAGRSRAVFMVLQGFAWENLRKDADPKMVLYPTRPQLRFMACQSIVHGVNGLIWWGLKFTPAGAPLWDDLRAVTRELRSLDTELAAPPARVDMKLDYHDTGHSLDRGIEWIAKPSGGGFVVIAVNADPNPVEVTFSAARLPGGRLRHRFEPFGVHILRAG